MKYSGSKTQNEYDELHLQKLPDVNKQILENERLWNKTEDTLLERCLLCKEYDMADKPISALLPAYSLIQALLNYLQ
jgi:hypothetical protein